MPEHAPGPDPAADGRPEVAVFDIDGVLADVRHRLHHVERRPKDWLAFFEAMDEDDPLPEGVELAHAHVAEGRAIAYLTGRSEWYRETTEDWLDRHGLPHGPLYMRPDSDYRPARVYKPQVLRRIARDAQVAVVVDDDDAVVEVLREQGWPVVHATWMSTDRDEQQALFDVQEVEGRS